MGHCVSGACACVSGKRWGINVLLLPQSLKGDRESAISVICDTELYIACVLYILCVYCCPQDNFPCIL